MRNVLSHYSEAVLQLKKFNTYTFTFTKLLNYYQRIKFSKYWNNLYPNISSMVNIPIISNVINYIRNYNNFCYIIKKSDLLFDVSTRVISLLLERIIIWKIETIVEVIITNPPNCIDIQHRLLIRIKGILYVW